VHGALGSTRAVLGPEETVDDGPRAADVRAEGAQLEQLVGQRRRGQVVRGQRCEIAGAPDPLERVEQLGATLIEAVLGRTSVEGGVHLRGGCLGLPVREAQKHPIVLRELERCELASVIGTELRARREEERHVCSELGAERAQIVRCERALERFVRELEGGGRIGAPAAETGRDRDVLLDPGAPAGLDAGRVTVAAGLALAEAPA
jgi:hypothetical protein